MILSMHTDTNRPINDLILMHSHDLSMVKNLKSIEVYRLTKSVKRFGKLLAIITIFAT